MKCYCIDTGLEFIFCIEDVPQECVENIKAAWFQEDGDRFIKVYPGDVEDKQVLTDNFARLGPAMFSGQGNWENALLHFAECCAREEIDWYIVGSVSEAARGVAIKPHDLDLVVQPKDFYRVKGIFLDNMVEPFADNGGTWLVRFFGRICLEGVLCDVVADEGMNKGNHAYEAISWKGYTIEVEPLHQRYETELHRKRQERVQAIEAYMQRLSASVVDTTGNVIPASLDIF